MDEHNYNHLFRVLSMSLFLLMWKPHNGLAQSDYQTMCANITASANVSLNCNENYWFHVVREVYSNDLPDNCTGQYANVNTGVKEDSDTQLVMQCVGKQHHQENKTQKCVEDVDFSNKNQLQQNGSKFVRVEYECIPHELNHNICEDVSVGVSSEAFLASPDLFGKKATSDVCRCRVRAAGLQVQILYVSLSDSSGLNVKCINKSVNCTYQYVTTDVNRYILQNTVDNITYTMDITYLDSYTSDLRNRLWIRFKGSQNVSIVCNGTIENSTASQTTEPATQDNIATQNHNTNEVTTHTTKVTTSPGQMESSAESSSHSPHLTTDEFTTSPMTDATTTAQTRQITTTQANQETTVTTQVNTTGTIKATSHDPTEVTSHDPTEVMSHGTTEVTSRDTTEVSSITGKMNDAAFSDTHIYIIAGVAGGVCVLLCCAAIVLLILRHRRRKREKMDVQVLYHVSADLDPDLSSEPGKIFTPEWCEADLDDDPCQPDNSPSVQEADLFLQKVYSTFRNDGPQENHASRGSSQPADLVPMKTLSTKPKPQNTDGNQPENKTLYFILKPEGGDDNDPTLAASRVTLDSGVMPDGNADEFDDDSCHYYSQIKDTDYAAEIERRMGPSKTASASRRENRPCDTGLYEVAEINPDEDSEDNGANGEQGSPRRGAKSAVPRKASKSGQHSEQDDGADDGDELVMVDNEVYESAGDSVRHTPRHDERGSASNDSDEDDKLIMLDNVIYQSSASLDNGRNRSRGTGRKDGGAIRGQKTGADEKDDRDDDNETRGDDLYSTADDHDDSGDEELIMVDNDVYQSGPPLGSSDENRSSVV